MIDTKPRRPSERANAIPKADSERQARAELKEDEIQEDSEPDDEEDDPLWVENDDEE